MKLRQRSAEPFLFALVAVTMLWSLWTERATLLDGLGEHYGVVLIFGLAIVIGENMRVRMPSGRITAPVSIASGIALAFLGPIHGRPAFDESAAFVALVAGAALAVSGLVLRLRHQSANWHVLSARVMGIAVTAALARDPFPSDIAVWQLQFDLDDMRWLVALAMLAIAAAGLYVDLILTGGVRAQRNTLPVVAALKEELSEAQVLTLGLLAAGPLITFLAPVIGLVALPLGMTPMMLTYIAVRRFVTNRETYRQTIATLSRLTDVAGYTPDGHAERVAVLSVAVGRRLGMPASRVVELEYAALLHDLGQVRLTRPIPDGATALLAPFDQQEIANEGAHIVRRTEVLDSVADMLERQTVPYRRVRERRDEISLESRIIKVANAFDDYSNGSESPESIASALERLHLGLGYEYDPEVVETLTLIVETSTHPSVVS